MNYKSLNFNINPKPKKKGMEVISKYNDNEESKHLLFMFKSNRLTDRVEEVMIPSILFRIFDRPSDDTPTLYDISEDIYGGYSYVAKGAGCYYSNETIYLAPFPNTIWHDNTTFSELSRRMTAIYNCNMRNILKVNRGDENNAYRCY